MSSERETLLEHIKGEREGRFADIQTTVASPGFFSLLRRFQYIGFVFQPATHSEERYRESLARAD